MVLPHYLFYVAMTLAGIGWLALILYPRQPWANLWLSGVVLPLLLGVLYSVVMIAYWGQNPKGNLLDFFALGGEHSGLLGMFHNAGLLLAAFIDLLVMPLIVGAWMARKAAQIRMPYVYLLLCLLSTFAVPATGFVLFVLIVAVGGQWSEVAKFEGQPPTGAMPVFGRPR